MFIYKIQFFVFVLFIFISLPNIFKRPALWIAFMLFSLALIPNSSVFQEERILGEGFKLFTKYIGGILSIWDIFTLFGFYLVLKSRSEKVCHHNSADINDTLHIIYIFWFFSVLNGLAHATFFQYGYTSFRSVVQQAQPAVYFILSLFLTRSIIKNEQDIDMMIKALSYCNLFILAEGVVFFVLGITEVFYFTKGFGGIPIVIYDGMGFLAIGVLIVIAKYMHNQRITYIDIIVLLGGIAFILLSTRRMNLLMLFINVVIIWLATDTKDNSVNKTYQLAKLTLLAIIPLAIIMPIVVPDFIDIFINVLNSINMSSEAGEANAGLFRLAQISNLFLNMNEETPFSYIWGMGLGTQWYEFIPLIGLQSGGDTAYVMALQDQGELGWWPYFHIANIAVIYRYGVLGVLAITYIGFLWFMRFVRANKTILHKYQPVILVFTVTIFETIIIMGESLDSSYPAQLGIWLGVSGAILNLDNKRQQYLQINRCLG